MPSSFSKKIVSCMKRNNLYLGLFLPSSGWWSPIRHVQSSTFGFSACFKITFFYFLSVFHKTQILNSNQWNFSLIESHHHNVLIKILGLSPPLVLCTKRSMSTLLKQPCIFTLVQFSTKPEADVQACLSWPTLMTRHTI